MQSHEKLVMLKDMDADVLVEELHISTEELLIAFPEKVEKYIYEEKSGDYTFVEEFD